MAKIDTRWARTSYATRFPLEAGERYERVCRALGDNPVSRSVALAERRHMMLRKGARLVGEAAVGLVAIGLMVGWLT